MSHFAFLIAFPGAFFEALPQARKCIDRTRNEALMCPFAGTKPAGWFTNRWRISSNGH